MAKFCPECGNRIKSDRSAFCDECGAKLSSAASQPQPSVSPEKPPRQQSAAPSQPHVPLAVGPKSEALKPEAPKPVGPKVDWGIVAKTALPAGILFGVATSLLDAVPPLIGSLFLQNEYTLILSLMQYVAPVVVFLIGILSGFAACYAFKLFKIALLPDSLKKQQFYSGAMAGALVGAIAAFLNFLFPIIAIVGDAMSPATPGLKITLVNALMVVVVFVLTLLLGAVGGALAGSYANRVVK